ncbi:MAG: tRNA dihydrouridine synthase DusB [Peptococcaceae bacterium]|nr:tRNA dihydrouridine synthase DusB [Peptococcaceae bacterium]
MLNFNDNPYCLAPMAGVTDKAMRLICRRFGAGLEYTEMVSAKALHYNNKKSFELFDLADEAAPITVQLFGSEPEIMAEGARLAVEAGAAMLDVNMGCPVPKVAGHGEGSGLLRTPETAWAIIRAMREAVDVPLSAKMRIGWEERDPQIVDFAKGLADAGCDFIAVHGRTRAQYYTGRADWSVIREIVEAVDIPVIANGDVTDVASARAIREATGAAAVMVGRGALGRPWLFAELLADWRGEPLPEAPSLAARAEVMLEHARLACHYKGERQAMQEMRKQIGWYVKGLPHAAALRRDASYLNILEDLETLLTREGLRD